MPENELKAIIEPDGDWYIAYCPEIAGLTVRAVRRDEARQNLAERIEDSRGPKRGLRSVGSADAIRETVTIK